MGEVCVEALVAALDEACAERDALTAEVEKLEETITTQRFDNGKLVKVVVRLQAKSDRLDARMVSIGHLDDDAHESLRANRSE